MELALTFAAGLSVGFTLGRVFERLQWAHERKKLQQKILAKMDEQGGMM